MNVDKAFSYSKKSLKNSKIMKKDKCPLIKKEKKRKEKRKSDTCILNYWPFLSSLPVKLQAYFLFYWS